MSYQHDSQVGDGKRLAVDFETMREDVRAMLPESVEIGDDDNLISLGLDSLQIMRLLGKWRRAGAEITFAELIGAPDLGSWRRLAEKKATSSPSEESEANDDSQGIGMAEEGPFLLTDVQHAYWVGRRDGQPLGGVGCHAYLEIDGSGVEPDRLESAWKNVLATHSMLRARFLADGMQEIQDAPFSEELLVHDLRSESEAALKKELGAIRDRLSHRRLDVEKGEVSGLELSLLPKGRSRLHFDVDLLVADVQSLQIILRDLAAAYAHGFLPAAPSRWRFAGYLKQESQRRSLEEKQAGNYWAQRLDTLPGAPGLPLKEMPEALSAPYFKRRQYAVNSADWGCLQERAAAYGVTPAMVFLALYAEVLDRWSSNSQFLINIPLFDRQAGAAGIDDVVADFTNLLLLAVDCSARQSFVGRVRDVQAQFHRDVAHAAYSGVRVQRDLSRVRRGERLLAPVVFASNLGAPLIGEEGRETLGNLSYMISQTPQVWLDFQLYEMDKGLLLAWDSVDALFPDGLMDQMFEAFSRCVQWLVGENNDWRASPDALPFVQRKRLERDLDFSIPKPVQCLHDSFFECAGANPGVTALIDSCSDSRVTYGELSGHALRMAAFLKEKGVGAGDPVAVTLPRGADQIAAVLGILAIGAFYVPVGTAQPSSRRGRIHRQAGIGHVLTDHVHLQAIDWPVDVVVLDVAAVADRSPLAGPEHVSAESLAYVIFTSGSTGEPKGVEIRHCAAWNTIADINLRYGVGEFDRMLAVSALDFDLSVYDIFGVLGAGGALVLVAEEMRRDAAHWLELVRRYQVTLWNSVPILMDMLLVVAESAGEKDLPLRQVMLSGDWIGRDLPARLDRVTGHCSLVAMGGATEASIWSNYFDVALPVPDLWASIPYGRPLANQAYRIVDSKGRECPDWVAGELWIGGAGVAEGYRGNPDLTAERFVDWNGFRWYRTGDLGKRWSDGTIEFLGREDFQVKIRGHRVELGEIETALKRHPGVREAVVTAVDERAGGKRLVGYVVPEKGTGSSLFDVEEADADGQGRIWRSLIHAGSDRGRRIADGFDSEFLSGFWAAVEEMAVVYICRALTSVGGFDKPGATYGLQSLVEGCGIHPRYAGLVEQWLKILEEDGVLRRSGEDAFVNPDMLPVNVAENGAFHGLEHSSAWKEHVGGLTDYLDRLSVHFPQLLRGEVDPLPLFFSRDPLLSPEYLLNLMPGAGHAMGIAERIVAAVQEAGFRERPLRILEVGFRTGTVTEKVLPVLSPERTTYTCADGALFFINKGKEKFKDYGFVQYQLLDMDQNPLEQGYAPHSYDIVIAPNSLHRAGNIGTTLSYLQSLLTPGGLLVALEMTRNSRLQKISVGLIESFDHFRDHRREESLPLLSLSGWEASLHGAGFEKVAAFGGASSSEAAASGQHVIVARASSCVERFNSEGLVDLLHRNLPDHMVPSVYVPLEALPLTANGKLDRKKLPVPEQSDAELEMEFVAPRTSVEVSLAKIWRRVFKIQRVGVRDNFFQLGGDSLLAVQLVSRVNSAFNVELPLERLFEAPTIAELAACLSDSVREQAGGGDSASSLPRIVPDPGDRYLPFPLTDIQHAYWVGRSGVYELGNVATHCYFEIEGVDLDPDRLTRGWQRLIDHHEMMRTVVLPDGQQQQILETAPPYGISVLDLRGKDVSTVESELAGLRDEMSHQVMAADQWPLFDVRMSRFGTNRVRLHIGFDNLIFDGWSMFHLLSEWTRLYDDPDASLAPLELSFRDYVLALEPLNRSESYQRDLAYWAERLPGLPPAPELPLARNPGDLLHQRFTRLDARLDRRTWGRLKRQSAQVELTPSVVLLAAYAEVLGIWSRHPWFTINLTQFNRLPLHPQVGDIVGDFTTLTLLAVDLSQGGTFLERARNLQQQLWQDLDHPHVGGIEVQRQWAKQRGEQQGGTMPVVFTSALGVDQWSEDGSGRHWMGKLVYNITQTPQVWLDHQVVEQDGELLLFWDAVEGLFPGGLLEDMFGAYTHILQRLADNEAEWRDAVPTLVSVPRLDTRIEANDTDAPVTPQTLTGLFAEKVVRQPDCPAVISSGRTLTYGQLSGRSGAVAELLQKKGVRPDTLVAVVMEKGWEQVVAVLGILKSGAAYLPVDSTYPEERRRDLLQDGGIRLVLTQSWLEERLSWPEGIERFSVDGMGQAEPENCLPESCGRPEDLAYVIYTSGSTGFPKGVMIDHRGAVNTIQDVNKRFSVGPEDRVLALSNLNFDLSVYDVFGMLSAGATIVIPDADKNRDPLHWLEVMEQENITVWNTVPALMQMLVEDASRRNRLMPKSLRLVLLSGDWIPLDLPDRIRALFKGVQVIGLGGATEASIWSNLYPVKDVDPRWKSIPYGRPMANQRYHVLNEFWEDCPVWVPGQLYIGGAGLAKGYWQDTAKTDESFVRHPRTGERLYRTGDLGRYLPDGNLEFLGREDFQVKIRGHRIGLGEIEAAMKDHEGVKDAVVAVAGASRDGHRLVGYVVPEDGEASGLFTSRDADSALCAAQWLAMGSAGRSGGTQIPDAGAIPAFMAEADRLSFELIGRTLHNMGAFTRDREHCTIDGLMGRLKIDPRFQSLILHWLDVLVEEGVLEKNRAGTYLSPRSFDSVIPGLNCGGACRPASDLSEGALALDAFYRQEALSYRDLLQGRIDPLELFLREDSPWTPEALGRFDPAREYFSDLFREVFFAIVNSHHPDKELRVLEIGTRAGSLAGKLAPLLQGEGSRYLYADESSFFTDREREKNGEGEPFEYGLFDMNNAPLQQGYDPHSFHVVVANNTLHRSRNIEETLVHLKAMLAPGGYLLFIESTRNTRLLLTTVGFFEDGFSHLEDERRTSRLPLLTEEKWRGVLEKIGFPKVRAFSECGHAADGFGQHLLVAQAPESVRVFEPGDLAAFMRRRLPDYMVPATYVLLDEVPVSANGKIDRKALAELAGDRGRSPEKDHIAPFTGIQLKIAAVWEEVLGCDHVGIHDSFFELGGDSLRAIQCVNLLKERYGMELTLQNLFEAPGLGMLADLVEAAAPADEPEEVLEEGLI